MNIYEEQILRFINSNSLSQDILVMQNSSYFYHRISELYPFSGSKINWSALSNVVSRHSSEKIGSENKQCIDFFDEILAKYLEPNLTLIYLSDNAIDFALKGHAIQMRKIIKELFDMPQHHYFTDDSFTWCMTFTMEGYMDFGFSVQASKSRKVQSI